MKRLGLTIFTVLALAGCASQQTASQDQRLADAQAAFARRDYATSYRLAGQLQSISRGSVRDESAYLAGLSAHKLNNQHAAESYLQMATGAYDKQLAADANAELGLLHSEQGRYDLAARDLLRAAPSYTGEARANAYFYAAVAQQKLGQWPQARTNLVLARAITQDPAFRTQVETQLAVTGYTIQVGAYRDAGNARSAADRLSTKLAAQKIGSARLVASTDSAGVPVTLLHVGRFATFNAATSARQQLGDQQAIIVPLSK